MIIVKNAEIGNICNTIDIDKSFIDGLVDNLTMLSSSEKEVKEEIFDYIQHNAVLNGISVFAHRNASNKHNLLETLQYDLENASYLYDEIEKLLKKSGTKVFDTTTITYREKGMFDWLSSLSFFGNYTAKLIDILLTQPKTINSFLTKGDFEFINKTVNYYNTMVKRLSDSRRNLINSITMLSDEVYDPDYISIIEDAKGKEAVTVGLLPHELNPGHWVRYMKMRWDVKTIKSNQEKIDMYASKLQQLENKRLGNNDPSLDLQIEKWQNEIQILDTEIKEIFEKYEE